MSEAEGYVLEACAAKIGACGLDFSAPPARHVKAQEVMAAAETYAAICAGVAREECRGTSARPDYIGRHEARLALHKMLGLRTPTPQGQSPAEQER